MPLAELTFDHLVILTRERLNDYAQAYQQAGFYLSPISTHTIGSSNQLIVLDTTYIELLGWTSATHTIRPDIKDRPAGADALVFRTQNAQACYERLSARGFVLNPVQRLVRMATIDGIERELTFNTVRFTHEPITGIRIYFCEHLTPEYVWHPTYQQHSNQSVQLQAIDIRLNAEHALRLKKILAMPLDEDNKTLHLNNLQLNIQQDESTPHASIEACRLLRSDHSLLAFTLTPTLND